MRLGKRTLRTSGTQSSRTARFPMEAMAPNHRATHWYLPRSHSRRHDLIVVQRSAARPLGRHRSRYPAKDVRWRWHTPNTAIQIGLAHTNRPRPDSRTHCAKGSLIMSKLDVPGAKLYHEVYGDGPMLLCISGADGSCEIWRDFAEELKDRFKVILWDRKSDMRILKADRR